MSPANRKKTGESTQFKKGQSGNPSGRPAVAREFRERCREFMESDGWDELIAIARGKDKDKRAALELIAAYAYGKPRQGLDVEHSGGTTNSINMAPLTSEELRNLAKLGAEKDDS